MASVQKTRSLTRAPKAEKTGSLSSKNYRKPLTTKVGTWERSQSLLAYTPAWTSHPTPGNEKPTSSKTFLFLTSALKSTTNDNKSAIHPLPLVPTIFYCTSVDSQNGRQLASIPWPSSHSLDMSRGWAPSENFPHQCYLRNNKLKQTLLAESSEGC